MHYSPSVFVSPDPGARLDRLHVQRNRIVEFASALGGFLAAAFPLASEEAMMLARAYVGIYAGGIDDEISTVQLFETRRVPTQEVLQHLTKERDSVLEQLAHLDNAAGNLPEPMAEGFQQMIDGVMAYPLRARLSALEEQIATVKAELEGGETPE